MSLLKHPPANASLSIPSPSSSNFGLEAPIRRWLQSADGRRTILQVSTAIIKRPELVARHPAQPVEQEDIAQELVLFILETNRLWCKVDENGGLPPALLREAFLNRLSDQVRHPAQSSRAYLYRRFSRILKLSSGEFCTKGGQRGVPRLYSKQTDSFLVGPLAEEELRATPFPEPLDRCWESINRSQALLTLARHFWNHVTGLWGGKPLWLRVADIVSWVELFVSLPRAPNTAVQFDPMRGEDDPMASLPDPICNEIPVSVETIAGWANKAAARFSADERCVWLLHLDQGLSLKEVARRTGHHGPSGPAYQLKQAQVKLKAFMRDLPGLSPEDLNSTYCDLFFETLSRALKTHNLVPCNSDKSTRRCQRAGKNP